MFQIWNLFSWSFSSEVETDFLGARFPPLLIRFVEFIIFKFSVLFLLIKRRVISSLKTDFQISFLRYSFLW